MYIDGKLLTAGEKTRLHSEPFGVRTYIPEKCSPGYTLFSPAWGDQEYLIDMRGLVVHTWRVTHSNVAELLPNGNLFTQNCGSWLEELTPDSETVWRWEGDASLTAPNHHDFWVGRRGRWSCRWPRATSPCAPASMSPAPSPTLCAPT